MSEMTLFGGGNPLVNSELFKSLRDMNKTLAGGSGGGGKRISIKGNKFRLSSMVSRSPYPRKTT